MVVRRKPANVDEFIREGGSAPQVAAPQPVEEATDEEVKGLKLRLPVDLLKRVDEMVKSRRPAPSRHQWILEAIYEKLDREASE
ncbi:ribbon-helix-helix protein, CopG family [Phormidesmis priestleyi]|uniref:ribbon-helix-helix protein, CopG family n=1 Tax=Phormidesmis priestleyi TaxID=268141 RepID=UPI00083A21AD|nr:ribbon-helix-helix protein, CopG family [Phormidesmis priestleyi]